MPQATIAPIDLLEMAKDYAGNWKRFDSFAWFDRPDDADFRCIVYFSNRDSDILTRSNAKVYERKLSAWTEGDDPDVILERHNHWAVGYVDGASIRVYSADGSITPAFAKYCALKQAEEDYPSLDDDQWSEMEYEESIESWEAYGRDCFRDELLKILDDEAQEQFENLEHEAKALDALWESVRDSLGQEYYFDNSGCNFYIEGAIELLTEMADGTFWAIVEASQAS